MSDTSQGEGWWIASDGKWYAPELHPDYVMPIGPPQDEPPVKPTTSHAAETVAIPAPDAAALQAAAATPPPGPSFTPAGEATQTYVADAPVDPNYNLPESEKSSASKRPLILGVGALVLVLGLGFLAFRFFGASGAGGADSPEAAIDQLIASVNERDAVGFVDVFDPDEIDAWFGSFAPALSQFDDVDDAGEETNDIADAYASVFSAFDYQLTGPRGESVTYDVETLDDSGRIARVRIEGLDFELLVDEPDRAVILGFDDEPVALDVNEFDGARAEFRDEPRGLATRLFVPGEETVDEFAPDAHLDFVTVQKDGKWFVSIGYSFLEIARNQGEFDEFGRPDFGRGFDLVADQTGGAESAEAVVNEFFDSIEQLDYEAIIDLIDPLATPYLHDYQPLISSQVDEADRQQAVRDASLRFDTIELGLSEWEGRTLVTIGDVRASVDGGNFDLDTTSWCATFEDEFGRDRACLEDAIADLLFELDSNEDPRDFIPEQTGIIVVERNGRWYLDPLGTMGFYADQLAEVSLAISDEFEGNVATEVGDFFVVEGPVASQNMPAVHEGESGAAGVALDLSDYPTVSGDFNEFHVAVARVVTNEPGTFVSYDDVPLTGEDWIVAFDPLDGDIGNPAIAASTNGSLDVELFEVQVGEIGPDGVTGQLGGQGRPQVFTVNVDTFNSDVRIEGASADTIFGWENAGIVLNRPGRDFIGDGAFVVVYGEPGAPFTITVEEFFEEPEPEPEPDPVPEPDPFPTFDDPRVEDFAFIAEPSGFAFDGTQTGGFFDGCGGPNDPDVESTIFSSSGGGLLVITPYPSATRAAAAFDQLVNLNSPCEAFTDIEVNEVIVTDNGDIRVEWQPIGDPAGVVYEQYRLVGDSILVATNSSLFDLDVQLALLDIF